MSIETNVTDMEPCACRSWVRIPTDNYPMSNHHPECRNFKTERFVKIILDGSHCIVAPHEVDSFVDGADRDQYTFEDVYLTKEQFQHLPEFGGF